MKKFKRALFFTAITAAFALTALGAAACQKEEHTAHSWDGGIITERATCGKDGVRTYTCTVCKETKTEPITKTGNHTWDKGSVTTAATCVAAGVMTYTCTVCNETKTDSIEAKGHTWNEGVSTATCTVDGKITYTCTVCKETKEEDAKATGHKWGEDGFCTVCEAYSGTIVTVLKADGKPAVGVIVKAANETDGLLYSAVTDKDGVALMVGINDKSYQVQLYNLPEGASYDIQKVAAEDDNDKVTVTLKSGEVAKFESEGENEIKSAGAYSVTVPLTQAEIDGSPLTGMIPVTLNCNYYGGAKYVISWKEGVYFFINYSIGNFYSNDYYKDNTYDEATKTYSISFLLAYGETATINFGGDLYYVPAEDFPYTYAFNVNMLEAPLPGSEVLPLAIKEGKNTVKGLALEDGSGYYAHVNLTVEKAGDYTFTLSENTKLTYEKFNMMTSKTETIELVNGSKITSTDMWATTYNLYAVSDKEKFDIDIAYSFTPGSLDAPYEMKIGNNTANENSTTYFTLRLETAGKYTLRSSSDIIFYIYEGKEKINDVSYFPVNGEAIVFSYEANKTYYITADNGGTEFTFTAYNAETDRGLSKDDPKAITLGTAATYEGSTCYYTFTPAKSGYYSVTIDSPESYSYSISVYSDNTFTTEVKGDYKNTLIFQAEEGKTYYIQAATDYNGTVTVAESQGEEVLEGKELVLGTVETLIAQEYFKNLYYFTATETGAYKLTASWNEATQNAPNIFQTQSNYDHTKPIGSNGGEYTFNATAGETYYFSVYAGDGGTVTLNKATDEDVKPTIHGTFQVGENNFTASNKDYNATMTVATAGKYTFAFTSNNMFWSEAKITVTVNGKDYTASSTNNYTVEIELPAGEVTITVTCNFLSLDLTMTISK